MASDERKFKDFSAWFDEVLLRARIVDPRYPVKGFIVYLENGKMVIEAIRRRLEELLEEDGHKPMLFPLVATPENFAKEAEHIKGFQAEVFKVKLPGGGGERELIVRPTSETIMYPMFSLWIKDHSNLPLKVHQSCEVYRYETKATRPLFRVREVLWNEAHTVHFGPEDAEAQLKRAIEIYRKVLDDLGISYLVLKRPDFDKFAGAVYSIAFDAWNPDGRVNQVATVHNLGDNFSRAFEIIYEDKEGGKRYAWQLCYGFGYSRVLAAVIAQHGDDLGPIFPPSVAPVQVVIVPIPYKGRESAVFDYAREVYFSLKSKFRVVLDGREDVTPGEKYYYWERQGVPVRVEIGPKETEMRTLTLCRRDTGERVSTSLDSAPTKILELFSLVQDNLRARASKKMEEMIQEVRRMEELAEAIVNRKICRANWCGSVECANTIKSKVGGEIRGHRYDVMEQPFDRCIACGSYAKLVIYVARAY